MRKILINWVLLPFICLSIFILYNNFWIGWFWRIILIFFRGKKSTLYSIRMNYVEFFMKKYSSAPLFSKFIVLIFWFHCFLGKDTIQILKVRTVIFNNFSKYLSFYLIFQLSKSIAIYKKVLKTWMAMKVKIKINCFNSFEIFL